MNIRETPELAHRAAVHSALGDVTRLRIVDLLVTSDRSASELGTALAIPSNLLAHHLSILESAGLISRRGSEGDRRRSYVRLTAEAEWALPTGGPQLTPAARVVFVCTANTARSHLAAAAWRRVSGIPATSAGTHPGEAIHPGAQAAARRHGVDLPDVTPREFVATTDPAELVITVCDRAHEDLAGQDWAHWSVPDPVPTATEHAFDAAFAELTARIDRLSGHVTAR